MRMSLSMLCLVITLSMAAQDMPRTGQEIRAVASDTLIAETEIPVIPLDTLVTSIETLPIVIEIEEVEEEELVEEETEERPPNARPGLCYAKLINSDETIRWKTILCEWKEWVPLEVVKDNLEPKITNYDEHYINKRLKPLIIRGLSIEIESYYNGSTSDETDDCLAFRRGQEVGEFLVQLGLPRAQYKITVLPKTEKDTFYMNYRVINTIPKKWYLQ